MSILSRLVARLRGIRFEDYEVQTGYTNVGNKPWAGIEESSPFLVETLHGS
jgi:hypothetical protein